MGERQLRSPTSGRRPSAFVGLFLIAGLGMLGGAGYLAVDTRHDIAVGASADGIVTDLILSRDSDGDDTFYPRVRFVTPAGEAVEFTGSVGSSPAAFDVGETVAVLYDPAAPQDARIDSFFQLWFGPLIPHPGVLGACLQRHRRRRRHCRPPVRPWPCGADSRVAVAPTPSFGTGRRACAAGLRTGTRGIDAICRGVNTFFIKM